MANHLTRSGWEPDFWLGSGDVLRLGLLLLPEFPLYALVPAIEALRIANQNFGRRIFDWELIATEGDVVTAGNGMAVGVNRTIREINGLPVVLVFAGNHPTQHLSPKLLNWLRRLARHGTIMGAIDTGAFALAEAGLLAGHKVTMHWESVTTFRDTYPDIAVEEALYLIDRDRISCAGGHATLDLMLALIARHQGPTIAGIVANAFVCQRLRDGSEPQRLDVAETHRESNARSPLGRVLQDMEAHIATPLTASVLAKRAGLSVRAMNRVLRARTDDSPMRYYRKLRLQAARNALFYSDAPIQDIALACGFDSPEVFSRCFRKHFGVSPREFRRQYATEELKRFRPELDAQLHISDGAKAEGISGVQGGDSHQTSSGGRFHAVGRQQ